MRVYEKQLTIPRPTQEQTWLKAIEGEVDKRLADEEHAIRLAVTKSTPNMLHAEVGVLRLGSEQWKVPSIFGFKRREIETSKDFNPVLVIPTGIGAELGGHSGDGGAVARLIAGLSDNLITHPNVVNASDINELPENGLYVEGSVLAQLLMGTIGLSPVRSNRVLTVIDDHEDSTLPEHTINSVSAARASLGLDAPLVRRITDDFSMESVYSESGRAVGRIENLDKLISVIEADKYKCDAIAISSRIRVPKRYHHEYYLGQMVNPWGGVEAMLTHAVSLIFDIPAAHSPMAESQEVLNLNVGVVDPRMAAEVVSATYFHSVLKGLHRSPRIHREQSVMQMRDVLTARDISALVIPDNCIGLPTLAAMEQGIPVVAVAGNRNLMRNSLDTLPFEPGKLLVVRNYLEAAGVLIALKSGVSLESVSRPLTATNVIPSLVRELVEEYGNVVRLKARDEKV